MEVNTRKEKWWDCPLKASSFRHQPFRSLDLKIIQPVFNFLFTHEELLKNIGNGISIIFSLSDREHLEFKKPNDSCNPDFIPKVVENDHLNPLEG
jgi:hypothetical protein